MAVDLQREGDTLRTSLYDVEDVLYYLDCRGISTSTVKKVSMEVGRTDTDIVYTLLDTHKNSFNRYRESELSGYYLTKEELINSLKSK